MADFKLDQVRPLGQRSAPERAQAPAKAPGVDFGKALDDAQIKASAAKGADMTDLKAKAQAVIDSFEKDAAQFTELMKASQSQAKLIQSMMNRKPDPEA